jgi:dihydrofolate synthase / folylpolyglutamate synthase
MNYKQTLDYLYNALPMFHRVGAAAYKPNLDNTIKICNLLGNPQQYIKCIHVAGTNGKGSVSNMLASVLQEAGYKTGLYTSPHLKDFRERIRINGIMINRQYICNFVEEYRKDFEKIQPSFFEMTVGLCFQYFKDKKIDVAVIETGLGGRLDSTNVITPVVSIITNIGYDHMNLLGNTLEEIAGEKAGIIKRNVPVVIGEYQKNLIYIFKDKAKQNNAPLYVASSGYKAEQVSKTNISADHVSVSITAGGKTLYKNLRLDLTGNYQLKNVCTVLQGLYVIRPVFPVSEKQLKDGLKQVQKNTGFAGRWQVISKKPLVIADTGHNAEGIKEVLQMLNNNSYKQLHFVLGMVNDKAIDSILKLLPKTAVYYFCKADIPRGLDPQLLADQASKFKLKGNIYSSVKKALQSAKKNAGKEDMVFVGGSTFTVAEAL